MKKHNVAGVMIAERFADELKFPKDLKFEVSHLVLHHDNFPEPERKSVRRFVYMLGLEMCEKLFVLQKSDVEAHSSYGGPRLERLGKIVEIYHEILESNPCLSVKELKIKGDDVLALGVSKGPMVGAVLEDVLNKVMEEEIPNEREAEISYVKERFGAN
jgi:tRNA nucleotidyltransferase (CCA-adding enzyme)